ncbi:MAG: multiheme c-type cytochrome [Pirellulales bacterium]
MNSRKPVSSLQRLASHRLPPVWPLLFAAIFLVGDAAIRATPGPAKDHQLGLSNPNDSQTSIEQLPPGILEEVKFAGVGSCAASGCHGGVGRNDSLIRGDEFLIWRLQDPHAQAYQVLHGNLSKRIITNLSPRPSDLKLGDLLEFREVSDSLQRRCLKCHATGGLAESESSVTVDGVSCESCHGNASNWLAAHTQDGWASREDKKSLGFIRTDNLVTRARACMKCHVGTIDGDVNHDLYAAGHPQLQFELFSYHTRLPKHWHEGAGSEQQVLHGTDYYHDMLIAGALCSAEAGLKLLRDRLALAIKPENATEPEVTNQVWPELSEYSCFRCHQDLAPETVDQFPKRNNQGEPGVGALSTWGTWHYALLESVCDESAELAWSDCLPQGLDPQEIRRGLGTIRESMGKLYLPQEELVELNRLVTNLHNQLETAINSWADDERSETEEDELLASRAEKITSQLRTAAASSWDKSAMLFLAIESLRESRVPLDWKRSEIKQHLKYPRRHTLLNSPHTNDPPRNLIDALPVPD